MNKVVINACYGRFGLSARAIERYIELKYNTSAFFYEIGYNEDYTERLLTKFSPEIIDNLKSEFLVLKEDLGEQIEDKFNYEFYDIYNIVRHDPILIQVVEELGELANGLFANLKIEEVKGNKYHIYDYDGMEQLETPESIKWIEI